MARIPTSLLLCVMLFVMTVAGCVLPEPEPAASASDVDPSAEPETTEGPQSAAAVASAETVAAAPTPEPNMTGEVAYDETSVGLCLGPGLTNIYCATRSVHIEGSITNLSSLPVNLKTFAGTISFTTLDEDVWSLHAMMRSGGMSSSQARENIETIQFEWSYLAEDGYALVATASTKATNVAARHEASLDLVLPAAVAPLLESSVGAGRLLVDSVDGGSILATVHSGSIYLSDAVADTASLSTGAGSIYVTNLTTTSLVAESGSGSINADEVTADVTELQTSSGAIYGNVRGVDATMRSSSGSVYASFMPTASGTLTIEGGAASLDVSVPEGEGFGYDAAATTGSGNVEIFLEDGNVTAEDRSATFLTDGLADRAIQTVVRLSTGSGSIVVYPIHE